MIFKNDIEKFCEMFPQIAEAIYRRVELNYAMEDINCCFDEEERPDPYDLEQLAIFYLDEFAHNSKRSLFADGIVQRYRRGELVIK